jgi:hypothetical protein
MLDLTDASPDASEDAEAAATPTTDDDPVARMVRSAIGRASRAATESSWRDGPAEQRAAMRATGRSLR